MTSEPKITVCIPFYNDKKFLKYAIQSVVNQSYTNWNLLLLDDGSFDGSLDVAKSFLEDSRIRLISDGINKGLIYRLNESIDLAKTEYYARMDADDIMHPDRLKTQLKILQKNEDIDVLGTNAYSIDLENTIRGIRGVSSDLIVECSSFIHPSIMGKLNWFRKNRYNKLAERFEDYELWYRTAEDSSFYRVNMPLLYYREYGNTYYKKYFCTFRSALKYSLDKSKLLTRSSLNFIVFSVGCFIKGVIYRCYSFFNKEDLLIKKRIIPFECKFMRAEAEVNLKQALFVMKNR